MLVEFKFIGGALGGVECGVVSPVMNGEGYLWPYIRPISIHGCVYTYKYTASYIHQSRVADVDQFFISGRELV